MQNESALISLSPSFSSYSDNKLAEIAARIVDEFDADEYSDEFYLERRENPAIERDRGGRRGIPGNSIGDEDEEEFEFASVTRDSELVLSQTSADEIFQNGKIRPVYPVFNRDFLLRDVKLIHDENEKENRVQKIRLPLRKLFLEERETTTSSSSSEADDLDGVTAENYCVWPPKAAAVHCNKSSSTGCSSKRWKLKELLHRSNSDGIKNGFVYLTHSNSGRKKEIEKRVTETPAGGGKEKLAPLPPYNRNGSNKKPSYLPYRRDLVGLFGNANVLRKYLQS